MDVPAPEDPLDRLPDPARRAAVTALADAYCEAVLAGDGPEAERVIREALDADLPEAVIGGEIIGPAMREVGALWEAGSISVADEHLATELSTRIIMLQREHFRIVHRRAVRRVLLDGARGRAARARAGDGRQRPAARRLRRAAARRRPAARGAAERPGAPPSPRSSASASRRSATAMSVPAARPT